MQDVGPPAHPFVTEHGAEDELAYRTKIESKRQRHKAWPARIKFDLRNFFHPPVARKHGDGDGDAEESLGKRGMCGGDGRWEIEKHCDAA